MTRRSENTLGQTCSLAWLSSQPEMKNSKESLFYSLLVQVFGPTNAWANGTVLRPFLQPERPLSSQEFRFMAWSSGIRTRDPHVSNQTFQYLGCTPSTIKIRIE